MLKNNRRIGLLYTASAAVALLSGCSGLPAPRYEDPETRCENPNNVAGTLAAIVAEPFVWPDKALQSVGDNLVGGQHFMDFVSGGYLTAEKTHSMWADDVTGETRARRIFGIVRDNAAAGVLIYGATSGGSSGSSGAANPNVPYIDIPIDPGTAGR